MEAFNNPIGGGMFAIVPFIIFIGFVVVFGFILVAAIRGIKTWNNNNSQPVLTVVAKVVAKRENISSSMHHENEIAHNHTSTTYYATFQVESGDRMEFNLNGSEYGLLVEGDTGKLTFQGSRYLGFKRNVEEM